jgi:hypothetical protein
MTYADSTIGWVSYVGTMWKAQQAPAYGTLSKIFASLPEAKAFLSTIVGKKVRWEEDNSPAEPTRYVGKITDYTP